MDASSGRPVVRGDWVSFTQAGNVVVGIVLFTRPVDGYPWGTQVYTTVGAVNSKQILEVRNDTPD